MLTNLGWIGPTEYSKPTSRPNRALELQMAQAKQPTLPSGPSGGFSGSGGADFLSALQGMKGPTSTMQQTTQANRSPELEALIQAQTGRLNELQTGYEGAFGEQQATFNDVIQSLINAYQTRAGREGGAMGTAALSSGLTPLEATGAGQSALGSVLQQMWPQVAGLRNEQAGVGIELQRALQGVDQEHGNLLTNVMAPYQQGIAGTTRTGETTDTLGRNKLIADYMMQQQQQQQQQNQWQAELQQALYLAQMGEAGATERAGMGQAGANYRTELGEEGSTGRTQMGLASSAQQSALDQQQQMDYAQLSSDLTSERDRANWDMQYGEGYTSIYDNMMSVGG